MPHGVQRAMVTRRVLPDRMLQLLRMRPHDVRRDAELLPELRREGNGVIGMWKSIAEFPKYEVSDGGEIRNADTGKTLSQFANNRGYLKVSLKSSADGKQHNVLVHRLVAKAFIENEAKERTQVNHINEDKSDNRACNLEWVTPSENVNHGTGVSRRAESLSLPVVMIHNGLSVVFDSAGDAERRTGIPAKSIQKCCSGKMATTHGASFAYLGAKVASDDADR